MHKLLPFRHHDPCLNLCLGYNFFGSEGVPLHARGERKGARLLLLNIDPHGTMDSTPGTGVFRKEVVHKLIAN